MVCLNKISVEFNSTDANGIHHYNYTLTDESGTLMQGSQKVIVDYRLPRRVNGLAHWEVTSTDNAGWESEKAVSTQEIMYGQDEECGLAPFITIISPNYGYSKAVPYTFKVGSAEDSQCRYSLLPSANWTSMLRLSTIDNRVHTAPPFSYDKTIVYVKCNDTTNAMMHSKAFNIGVDATAPVIIATLNPLRLKIPCVQLL